MSIGVTDIGYMMVGFYAERSAERNVRRYIDSANMIARWQQDLAEAYYELAREMRQYWNSYYRPSEILFVQEVSAEQPYTPQYELVAGRYSLNIRRQFGNMFDQVNRCSNRYCTGLTKALTRDIIIAQAQVMGDAMNFGYRYEEFRKDAKDDVRFSRRITMLGLGRDMLQQALSYGQAASNMGEAAARTMGAAAEARMSVGGGLASAMGYLSSRRQSPSGGSGGGNIKDMVDNFRKTFSGKGTAVTGESIGAIGPTPSGGNISGDAVGNAGAGVMNMDTMGGAMQSAATGPTGGGMSFK